MIPSDAVIHKDFSIDDELDELDLHSNVKPRKSLPGVSSAEKLRGDFVFSREDDEIFNRGLESLDDDNLKEVLKNSYKDLANKNHVSLDFKNFSDIANHLGDYSEKDSKFAKLWLSKMISVVTDTVQAKSAYTLGIIMSKILNLIVSESQSATPADLELLVGTTREVIQWQDKLDKMKDKYYIAGTDRLIKELAQEENSENSVEHLSDEALADIISKINVESEKEHKKKKEDEEDDDEDSGISLVDVYEDSDDEEEEEDEEGWA